MVLFPDIPIPQAGKQPVPASAGLQQFLTGRFIPGIPQALTATQPAQQISALVLGVNPQGQALVQTPLGQVALASSLRLAAGQQLVLEVLPQSGRSASNQPVAASSSTASPNTQQPGFEARIVRVNGVTPEAFFNQLSANTKADGTSPQNQTQQTPSQNQAQTSGQDIARGFSTRAEATLVRALLPEGAGKATSTGAVTSQPVADVEFIPTAAQTSPPLKAFVLNNAQVPIQQQPLSNTGASAETAPTSPTLAAIRPGDAVIVRIEPGSIILPGSQAQAAPTQTPAATTPATAGTAQPATAQPQQTGVPVNQTLSTAPLPLQPTSSNAISQPIATLPGVVIAQENTGEAVVQTAAGSLRLPPEVPLPRGTSLNLELLAVQPGTDPELAALLPQGFTSGNIATDALIRGSTGLDSLFRHLFALNPEAATNAADKNIPKPDKQFGTQVLTFLKQLDDGSFMDKLSQSIPKHYAQELNMPRFAAEFAGLRQAYNEPSPAQHWQFALVPVMDNDELRHMRWFKREQQGSAKNPNAKGTRFVIELETESLGSVQLDGLFFKQPKTSDFDLVVRSNTPFSEEEQERIRSIFSEYGEIGGYAGSIQFQSTDHFPVNPQSDLTAEARPKGHNYSV